MNLFQILGTIAVKNEDANRNIDETADKAQSMASKLGNKFQSAGNTISGIGKKLAPVSVAVGAVGTALVGVATKTALTTDNIDKMSQKLGISRTAYQEWDYILSQNGASIDSLKTGMKTLNNTLDSCAQKGDTTGTAFERLGISYDDLKGKSNEEVFAETIEALQNCTNETERTKLATELFGKAGVELAPLLNSGAASTEELRKKAHELGLVLSDEAIDAGVNMTDAMDTMKRSLSAAGVAIATAVMPFITQFCNYISAHMPQVISTIQSVVGWFDNLSPTIKRVIAVVAALLAATSPVLIIGGKLISGIGTVITTVGKLFSAVQTVTSVISKLFAVLMANPIALVIAAVVALVAGFIYLWNTSEGFRNFWIGLWEKIKSVVTTVVEAIGTFLSGAWDAIKNTAQTVWNGIKTVITTVWDGIKTAISTVLSAIKIIVTIAWNGIKTTVTTVVNGIKTVVTTVWNGIKTSITGILNGIKSVFTSVWNGIKTAVSTVISGIRSVISSGLNGTKNVAASALNGIKSKFTSVFGGVKSFMSGVVSWLKGIFNFNWSLPKIKLPHFSISGSFSLSPPSIPHIGVSWYKKAMDDPKILTEPTIFGFNPQTGMPRGGGEAGDEVVSGKDTLLSLIRDTVAAENASLTEKVDILITILLEYLPQIADMQVVLDDGVLVGRLAPGISRYVKKDISKDRKNVVAGRGGSV